jgi:DNA polymerase III delta prime subunit
MQILTEKYRPKTLSDMVGNIPDLVIDDSMPHLLLHGSAGCGKTTLARIIISMLNCDHIVLNASSERGIDVIRDKVRDFASAKSCLCIRC